MSNYPTLPIITDETGFTYSEGMNLLVNAGRYTASTPFSTTSNKRGNYISRFDGKPIHSPAPCRKGQKITLQAKSNLPWSSTHLGGAKNKVGFWLYWGTKANAMAGQYMYAQFVPGDTTTVFNKTIPVPDDSQLANLSELYFCFRFNTYSDGTDEVTGKFWDLMIEYGDKKHDYRPNPADLIGGGLPMSIIARGLPLTVRNSIDEAIQNSAAQLEQRLSTAITQTGESIKNEVAQQYYAKGDTDRIIAEASTILEQKYNSFEMTFNEFKQSVDSNQNLTNAEFATITKFIRFIDGNIFLGEEGNNQMLKIAKDRISFLQGNQEVAYISDSTLYIYDGVFLNSLRIGNFAFVPRANGSLDFKKVR
ncbi:hypothetical protein AAK706_01425 [Erysipelotrichaceae bacterium 66-17]